MGTTEYASGYAARYNAGTHGAFSADECANDTARHSAANSATNNVLTSPAIRHILGIGPAIALASPGIGIGCQYAGRHYCDKSGGENLASVHSHYSSHGLRSPLLRWMDYRHSCGVAKVRDFRAVLGSIWRYSSLAGKPGARKSVANASSRSLTIWVDWALPP